jgi:plasmid stability protein
VLKVSRYHRAIIIGRRAVVGQVIIRNLDDRVLDRLKVRAMGQRESLEQSLPDLPTEAAKPSPAELLADLERIRAMRPPRPADATYPTAEQLICEDRDTR